MSVDIFKVVKQGDGRLEANDLDFGVGFPAEWGFCGSDGIGGKTPDDAGTIYFAVSAAADELYEDGVIVSVTLQQMVEDYFDCCTSPIAEPRLVEGEHIADAERIIAALRSAADWLENRCAKPVPQKTASIGPNEA